ncbi:hypothetical protein NDU88_006367 [Pleurodeles waltl]|uniref:Uncharacterized protein n=1 Tax=Pleurodeles waltl TaxID=8319 RepID=A0AAV7N0R0_PLEWA|nr:hypothetical protein NDU88_006367 [Pleurodeles waltl]
MGAVKVGVCVERHCSGSGSSGMRMGLPTVRAGGGGSVDVRPGTGGGRLCGPDPLSDPWGPTGAEAANVESDGAPADPMGPGDPSKGAARSK